MNPDIVIANLSSSGSISMKLLVEKGRGYRPAIRGPVFEEEAGPIGRLQLDASFSQFTEFRMMLKQLGLNREPISIS